MKHPKAYNGRNVVTTLVLSILNGSSFLHTISWDELNFFKIISPIVELPPLEHLTKLMNNVVATLAPSFFIGFLHSCRQQVNPLYLG